MSSAARRQSGCSRRGAPGRDLQRQRDAQLRRRALRRGDVRLARRDLVEQRGVGDRAREEAEARQPAPDLPQRRRRDPVALGLQAEEAAAGGGDADRAGAVGRGRRRDEPRRDGARRPAAGAARRALEVPRVARDAAVRRLGEPPDAELGHPRDADDDRPGRAQVADELAVLGLGGVVGRRADRAHRPADARVLLHGDRHAEQRPAVARARAPRRLIGLGERALGEHGAERVELGIEARDALQRVLDELARRQLTRAHELCLARDAGEGEVAALRAADGGHATQDYPQRS